MITQILFLSYTALVNYNDNLFLLLYVFVLYHVFLLV